MAWVLMYHVVADLTVGKPELVEFHETETVKSAIRAIGESPDGSLPIWRKSPHADAGVSEKAEMRQQRFVGILNSLDIAAFLVNTNYLGLKEDQDKAKLMSTPVSKVVVPNNSLLRLVDPATRLIDAVDMMKQGVRRLLVRQSVMWKGASDRFSIYNNGKWLKNMETNYGSSSNNVLADMNRGSSISSSSSDKFCCLSREDVLRFLIGCLGALDPLPQTSIVALGAINSKYTSVESSAPAIEATKKLPQDAAAVAVMESTPEGQCKIIGEISACQLWKCDYLDAAWALANLSAGQFTVGVDDNVNVTSTSLYMPEMYVNNSSTVGDPYSLANGGGSRRARKFSSRSIGFFSDPATASPCFGSRSMYRGRSAPLTCKITTSLAAVMAQMLSNRATHVWVTDDESDGVLVGVVGYADIFVAVTKPPTTFTPANRSTEFL